VPALGPRRSGCAGRHRAQRALERFTKSPSRRDALLEQLEPWRIEDCYRRVAGGSSGRGNQPAPRVERRRFPRNSFETTHVSGRLSSRSTPAPMLTMKARRMLTIQVCPTHQCPLDQLRALPMLGEPIRVWICAERDRAQARRESQRLARDPVVRAMMMRSGT
jgi:hypothetical protein